VQSSIRPAKENKLLLLLLLFFGLEVNWSKTKLQYVGPDSKQRVTVDFCNAQVELATSFVYLGSLVHYAGSSELEIWRHM